MSQSDRNRQAKCSALVVAFLPSRLGEHREGTAVEVEAALGARTQLERYSASGSWRWMWIVGDALFLLSAVCWAAFTLVGPKVMAGIDPLRATTYVTCAGAVLLGLLAAPDIRSSTPCARPSSSASPSVRSRQEAHWCCSSALCSR